MGEFYNTNLSSATSYNNLSDNYQLHQDIEAAAIAWIERETGYQVQYLKDKDWL